MTTFFHPLRSTSLFLALALGACAGVSHPVHDAAAIAPSPALMSSVCAAGADAREAATAVVRELRVIAAPSFRGDPEAMRAIRRAADASRRCTAALRESLAACAGSSFAQGMQPVLDDCEAVNAEVRDVLLAMSVDLAPRAAHSFDGRLAALDGRIRQLDERLAATEPGIAAAPTR
ncbi:MAG: hypothetical protein HZB39_12550 [Planctomycetes bacterium]|nr:hypothetical protein [Planctomycetota bacterium]